MITEIVGRIQSGQINQQHVFDSVVGQIKTQEKRWIIDVDTQSIHIKNMMINIIDGVRPTDDGSKIEAIIPTKNGIHLITKRFDVMEFTNRLSERGEVVPDVQKKNPTLLYYPTSLDSDN
jgi:hypothetical protein